MPSAVEKGVRPPPPTTAIHLARTPKKVNPSTAARPSAAGKGGSEVPPDFNTTKHAHSQKKAKRSGQAERGGGGGSAVSPGYGNPARAQAEEGQAERSGHADRSGKEPPLDYSRNERAAKARKKHRTRLD